MAQDTQDRRHAPSFEGGRPRRLAAQQDVLFVQRSGNRRRSSPTRVAYGQIQADRRAARAAHRQRAEDDRGRRQKSLLPAKLAGILGLNVQDIGAQQTGMTVEAFKQETSTRRGSDGPDHRNSFHIPHPRDRQRHRQTERALPSRSSTPGRRSANGSGREKPDVIVFFYNDHGLNFFLDKMPTFAVGACANTSARTRAEHPDDPLRARRTETVVADHQRHRGRRVRSGDVPGNGDRPCDHQSDAAGCSRTPNGRSASCRPPSIRSSIRCRGPSAASISGRAGW